LYNHILLPCQILKQNFDYLVSWYPENVTKGHANFVHFSQHALNRGWGKGFYSTPERPRRTLERKETFSTGKAAGGWSWPLTCP